MAERIQRALMVYGGWGGHTPEESVKLIAPELRNRGFEVDVSNTLDAYLDPNLNRYNLIVQCWTMGTITGEQEKGLLQAVRSGVGFAGWHGGIIDSFRQNTEYQLMTGGQWVAHHGGCIPEYLVRIVDRDHPVTKGIDDFAMRNTEQYYCHVDPSNHNLCETTISGKHGDRTTYVPGTVMPYAWTRKYGEGNIFVASWGHTFKDFEVPQAKEIVVRGLVWASRRAA